MGTDCTVRRQQGPRKVPEAFGQCAQKTRGLWPKGGNFLGQGQRSEGPLSQPAKRAVSWPPQADKSGGQSPPPRAVRAQPTGNESPAQSKKWGGGGNVFPPQIPRQCKRTRPRRTDRTFLPPEAKQIHLTKRSCIMTDRTRKLHIPGIMRKRGYIAAYSQKLEPCKSFFHPVSSLHDMNCGENLPAVRRTGSEPPIRGARVCPECGSNNRDIRPDFRVFRRSCGRRRRPFPPPAPRARRAAESRSSATERC